MSKVTGPVFSINAQGKFASTVIFTDNKGSKRVKKYTAPENPQSTDQQNQRSFMTDSVNAWKSPDLNVLDKEAWNYFAKISKRTLSGLNIFCSNMINALKISKNWTQLSGCIISNITGIGCTVVINVALDLTGKLYIGELEKPMLTIFSGVFDTDHYDFTINDLEELTKYYFYIKNTAVGEVARTGIYRFKTSKYIPVIITMGNEPIWRNTSVGLGYTFISSKNPANADGRIKQIELYTAPGGGNFTIGIFNNVVSNVFSTRSYIDLGSIDTGYSSHSVDLEVKEGDYIGFYSANGSIVVENNPGEYWVLSGDKIPCENVTFNFRTFFTLLSLKGTGVG